MQCDVLVIGGGLSGLIATWQLSRTGVDVQLVEARDRFGGRALTIQTDGANCDLGPSWFWNGQPIIANLLNHFGLSYFEQFSDGAILIQQADGTIMKSPMQSPMLGSRRIDGGMTALVNAIANEIPSENYRLNHAVTALTLDGDDVLVTLNSPTGEMQCRAKQLALAIPLRIANDLHFSPTLPMSAQETLANVPTWMAGHAKFFALYDTPFWREDGLCGTAISRRGPLAEIHDGSPYEGDIYSLFGFVGLSASQRQQMGREQLIRLATDQLTALFGDKASQPQQVYLQDWSAEDYTASLADRQPQTRHPNYNFNINLGDDWCNKLSFIVSETASTNSGLVEGALDAGLQFVEQATEINWLSADDDHAEHRASMDWDWLSP
ncbi:MAG: FAD-dependent oxidoreductase [Chloroflexota bacterium]